LFETFVGPEDHWLPPDNFQEGPATAVAHRTSPTNMGLSLLANLSAYDFGYIQAGRLIERTRNAFATMQQLERHRGHFYNWYDTQTLRPLLPVYISTVDSGNLAGHLLTLHAGLAVLADQPVLAPRWLDGLEDTLNCFAAEAQATSAEAHARMRQELASALAVRPATLSAAREVLGRLAPNAALLGGAIDRQCRELIEDLDLLVPLTAMQGTEGIPTLREL